MTDIQPGRFQHLKVIRKVDFGMYLDDGAEGILLPKRFVPTATEIGDDLKVFVYHDGEERLIATTQMPKGQVGDLVKLKVVSVTEQGAFMDWGLMKDLFVPKSQQLQPMRPMGEYIVKIFIDEQTGRIAATERFEAELHNDELTVKELDMVQLLVLRRTDLGYLVAINNLHSGLLHHNEIYRNITDGDAFEGYIKKIFPKDATHTDYRIDVAAGKPGYARVENESDKILRMLRENGGTLPYHDKSDPEEIYAVFSMSKKTFKMTIGKLYREKKVLLEKDGVRMV